MTTNSLRTLLTIAMLATAMLVGAQETIWEEEAPKALEDSIFSVIEPLDSIRIDGEIFIGDSLISASDSISLDSLIAGDGARAKMKREQRDWKTWRPNPNRALWLALVIPGGGQIYNRKYWKLPIIYGGMMGCLYAMNWNNMMYKDYSQAYLDIMDSDPQTESYNKFLHLGTTITSSNEERYKTIFKKRKDKYRRWRDLSVFCLIGVYALSVIDAYVDAELSEFDISRDLSMKVEPAIMYNNDRQSGWLDTSSIGVNVGINF